MIHGETLFIAAISAYVLTLVILFWANKIGSGLSLPVVFVISAIAIYFFLLFAPQDIQAVASYIGIGILVLTLIVNLISQS